MYENHGTDTNMSAHLYYLTAGMVFEYFSKIQKYIADQSEIKRIYKTNIASVNFKSSVQREKNTMILKNELIG